MRKYYRAKAHYNMKEAGYGHVNRRRNGFSFFSRHWREFVQTKKG